MKAKGITGKDSKWRRWEFVGYVRPQSIKSGDDPTIWKSWKSLWIPIRKLTPKERKAFRFFEMQKNLHEIDRLFERVSCSLKSSQNQKGAVGVQGQGGSRKTRRFKVLEKVGELAMKDIPGKPLAKSEINQIQNQVAAAIQFRKGIKQKSKKPK